MSYDHNEVRCDAMSEHDCSSLLPGSVGTCCVCIEHGCAEAIAERKLHPEGCDMSGNSDRTYDKYEAYAAAVRKMTDEQLNQVRRSAIVSEAVSAPYGQADEITIEITGRGGVGKSAIAELIRQSLGSMNVILVDDNGLQCVDEAPGVIQASLHDRLQHVTNSGRVVRIRTKLLKMKP